MPYGILECDRMDLQYFEQPQRSSKEECCAAQTRVRGGRAKSGQAQPTVAITGGSLARPDSAPQNSTRTEWKMNS